LFPPYFDDEQNKDVPDLEKELYDKAAEAFGLEDYVYIP
jgi:hypothetical protein